MGNSASKSTRKLSKDKIKNLNLNNNNKVLSNPRLPSNNQNANEHNNPSLKDGQDPDFMNNLSKIDPVKINKVQTNFKFDDNMLHILQGRKKDDDENVNEATTYNRLSANSLLSYFNERKLINNELEVKNLNNSFNVNDELINQISKTMSSPSYEKPFKVKTDNEGGVIERVYVSFSFFIYF